MPSPIGHALAGVAAAWAIDLVPGKRAWRTAPPVAPWFARAGRELTLICAFLAVAPDLDLLFGGHRTLTHSLSGALFVALFAGALAANVQRPVARVATMCAAALGTHMMLDWLGADTAAPRGVQLLWPFSDRSYISGWDLFLKVERRQFLSAETMLRNGMAIAQELAILGPLVVTLWLVRVKALAGLSTEVTGRDHAAKERARPVLGIPEPFVHDVEDRQAHIQPDEIGKR